MRKRSEPSAWTYLCWLIFPRDKIWFIRCFVARLYNWSTIVLLISCSGVPYTFPCFLARNQICGGHLLVCIHRYNFSDNCFIILLVNAESKILHFMRSFSYNLILSRHSGLSSAFFFWSRLKSKCFTLFICRKWEPQPNVISLKINNQLHQFMFTMDYCVTDQQIRKQMCPNGVIRLLIVQRN